MASCRLRPSYKMQYMPPRAPVVPPPAAGRRRAHDVYLIKSLVHAAEVLRVFETPSETLRLRDVMTRTGYAKGMSFRLLYTLRHCGFIERVDTRYRLATAPPRRKRFRIGYAAQGDESSFATAVQDGLVQAAEAAGLDLVIVNNRYQPKIALKNSDRLVQEAVDLVIEFQTDDAVASEIAAKYREASIPVIAVDVPHPGTIYFGGDNYRAGLLAGQQLARWALRHWNGQVDEILLIELARAGALPAARMRGVLAGIRELLPAAADRPVVTLDGDGRFKTALDQTRRYLRRSKTSRILVGAANDSSALGAARAFQEAGRSDRDSAIVGQNAEPDARAELRTPRSPLIASVAYFPERYGAGLIRLAVDVLAGRRVPAAVFVKHQIVTRENVEHLYANDALLGVNTFVKF